MKPLISVIVPVYKVEKYLRKCVDSILSQTYQNLEIFLVDDGSPDFCGKICDEYSEKDNRIKVIHKKNGGLSDARNAALDICTGEYITLIDSDDWVSKYYVGNLVKAVEITGKKLAISWFQNIQEGEKEKESCQVNKKEIKVLTAEQSLKRMFYQDGIETSAWGKLYAKELFDAIRYPVGKLYEDIPVTYRLFEKSGGVAVIPNVDYFYLQRKDSIQYQMFDPRKLDAITHWEEVMADVDEKYPQLSTAIRSRYFRAICNILFQIKDDDKCKEILWNKLKEQRKAVLRDEYGRKSTKIAAALSYCGRTVMGGYTI